MKKLNKLTILISSLLVAVFFISCGSNENTNDLNKPVKVSVEKITMDAVPFQYEYPGNVEGTKQAKLSTKLMGEISYFPYEAGTKVQKGQLLAKIKSADIDAKKQQVVSGIAQAQAAYNNMEINYNRIKDLYDKGSASKKELEDMTLAFEMAKQRLKSAKEMEKEIDDVLSYAEIRAPFDGYIVNKFFQQGDIVAPGQPLMIVESFNYFKVVAKVPADEINLFKKEGRVKVYIDAISKDPFMGKVSEINPGGNPYSKQFEVQILLDKQSVADSKIMSGMYAKVMLENKTKPIVTVDKKSLINRGQLQGVYTLSQNNEALLRWLRLGKEINGKVQVLSGLQEGDLVIMDSDKVKDGLKVEVIK